MKLNQINRDFIQERKDIEIVKIWLNNNHLVDTIRDATDFEQMEQDIDFHGSLYGELHSFEVKHRHSIYPDFLVETLSNIEYRTAGWIIKSQADKLVYVFLIKNIIKKAFIMNLPKLKAWWLNEGRYNNYPIRKGKTDNLYETENRAVPLGDIPNDIIEFTWSDF
jgi:hypothetical protein